MPMVDENGLYPKLLRAIAAGTYPNLIEMNVYGYTYALDGRMLRDCKGAAERARQEVIHRLDAWIEDHHLRRVSVIDIEVSTSTPEYFIRDLVLIRGTCRATGTLPAPQTPRKPLWGRCRAKLRRWARRAFRR